MRIHLDDQRTERRDLDSEGYTTIVQLDLGVGCGLQGSYAQFLGGQIDCASHGRASQVEQHENSRLALGQGVPMDVGIRTDKSAAREERLQTAVGCDRLFERLVERLGLILDAADAEVPTRGSVPPERQHVLVVLTAMNMQV